MLPTLCFMQLILVFTVFNIFFHPFFFDCALIVPWPDLLVLIETFSYDHQQIAQEIIKIGQQKKALNLLTTEGVEQLTRLIQLAQELYPKDTTNRKIENISFSNIHNNIKLREALNQTTTEILEHLKNKK